MGVPLKDEEAILNSDEAKVVSLCRHRVFPSSIFFKLPISEKPPSVKIGAAEGLPLLLLPPLTILRTVHNHLVTSTINKLVNTLQ